MKGRPGTFTPGSCWNLPKHPFPLKMLLDRTFLLIFLFFFFGCLVTLASYYLLLCRHTRSQKMFARNKWNRARKSMARTNRRAVLGFIREPRGLTLFFNPFFPPTARPPWWTFLTGADRYGSWRMDKTVVCQNVFVVVSLCFSFWPAASGPKSIQTRIVQRSLNHF